MRRDRFARTLAFGLAIFLPALLPAQDAQQDQASPAPTAEKTLFGSIDVGARWVDDIRGDRNTYRSIVNLNEGVRLNGLDLNFEKPGAKLFDVLRLQSNSWGDPYNTARMEIGKEGLYRYTGSYSNLAYYNYLPSFANIQMTSAGTEAFFNQRAYDTRVRNYSNELQLFPTKRLTPYVAYERNSSFGDGITTLFTQATQFPIRNLVRWNMDTYRGGIRADFGRSHLTVEHGDTEFRDDQQVYSTEKMTGGNRGLPILGQQLVLTDGRQAYGIRGGGRFTKVLFVANPYDWVDLYGQVLYSNPKTSPTFDEKTAGNLYTTAGGLLFYNRRTDFLFGNVDRPRTSGSFSMELRPIARVRIRESFETDRIKTDSSAMLTADLFATNVTRRIESSVIDRLESSRNRQTAEVLVDVTRRFTVRGGYRYEWGDAMFRAGSLNAFNTQERVSLERHVGLFGAVARPWDRLTLSADAEVSDGRATMYRIGLQDYFRVRAQARYRIVQNLNFQAVYSILDNENPDPGVNYTYRAQAGSASLQWMPGGGKRVSILADYTRSSIRSDINYLQPPFYETMRSLYTDYAHTGTLMADIHLPGSGAVQPVITFGGSFVRTSGSRPSRYYQPIGRFLIPVHRKFQIYSEWRWYGFTQPTYIYEGFRTHMIMSGVRWIL